MIHELQILRGNTSGIQRFVLGRFGIVISETDAQTMQIAHYPISDYGGWMSNRDACSSGPIAWMVNRLREAGHLFGAAIEQEINYPFELSRNGKLRIRPHARFARTKLRPDLMQVVYPIDITASRVVIKWW